MKLISGPGHRCVKDRPMDALAAFLLGLLAQECLGPRACAVENYVDWSLRLKELPAPRVITYWNLGYLFCSIKVAAAGTDGDLAS